jgi:hypothetical protein
VFVYEEFQDLRLPLMTSKGATLVKFIVLVAKPSFISQLGVSLNRVLRHSYSIARFFDISELSKETKEKKSVERSIRDS